MLQILFGYPFRSMTRKTPKETQPISLESNLKDKSKG